jgi:hypothetical protein
VVGSVSVKVTSGGIEVTSVPEQTVVTITARCAWEYQDHPRRVFIDVVNPDGSRLHQAWNKELYDSGAVWNPDNPAGSDSVSGDMSVSYTGYYVFEVYFEYYADGDQSALRRAGPAVWALYVTEAPPPPPPPPSPPPPGPNYYLQIINYGPGSTRPAAGTYYFGPGTPNPYVTGILVQMYGYVDHVNLDGRYHTVGPSDYNTYLIMIDRNHVFAVYFIAALGTRIRDFSIPGSAVEGSIITISGYLEFTKGGVWYPLASGRVDLTWDGLSIGSLSTDSYGAFSASYQVPPGSAGMHTIKALFGGGALLGRSSAMIRVRG